MTRISVVVPTFNRADTLGRALDSVFAQTRLPDEVVVIDDGSTDGTAAVVARYPQVRLERLGTNGGAARARNEGIRRSSGELIAFLDSDDEWQPRKLERQLERMQADPGLALLCTGITVHERNGERRDHVFRGPRSSVGWSFADFQNYPFAPTTWLARRSLFEQQGLFDDAMPNCEDLDFLARVAHRPMAVLPEALVVKHNRPDSLDASLTRTAASYQVLFERHAALWARTPEAAGRSWRRLANMHVRAGQMAEARRALARGLCHEPFSLKSWASLAATALGREGYLGLRRRWAQLA